MVEIVVGVAFAAIGTGILAWSLTNLLDAIASRKWQTTEGVVVVSDLQREKDSEGGFMYRSEISYRYTVVGVELVSSRARFGDGVSVSWSGPAVKMVRKYRAGAHVVVHYNPEEPGEAVLETGVNGQIFSGLFLGLLFAVLGGCAIVEGLTHRAD